MEPGIQPDQVSPGKGKFRGLLVRRHHSTGHLTNLMCAAVVGMDLIGLVIRHPGRGEDTIPGHVFVAQGYVSYVDRAGYILPGNSNYDPGVEVAKHNAWVAAPR